jgi:Cdc6-like AAA superfamily ATPase
VSLRDVNGCQSPHRVPLWIWCEVNENLGEGTDFIIGLYGLPGSGKTARLDELKAELSNDEFALYDGRLSKSS